VAAAAVVTEVWRTVLARVLSRDLGDSFSEIVLFKIGEGGGSGGVPVAPLATRTDIEAEGEPLAGGGTVGFTNGTTAVVGTGTTFLADVSPGDWIKPGPDFTGVTFGSAGVPGTEIDEWGEVLTVDSDLGITLNAVYAGATLSGREGRTAAEPLFAFRKTLVAGDVLFNSAVPAITEVTSITLGVEANADQLGGAPAFFEVGLYDANGVLVVYMTMDQQTKTVGVQLNNVVDLVA
jgi:hypothetical protein